MANGSHKPEIVSISLTPESEPREKIRDALHDPEIEELVQNLVVKLKTEKHLDIDQTREVISRLIGRIARTSDG